jgi:hypothetical protein
MTDRKGRDRASFVVALVAGLVILGTAGSALAQASKQEYPIPTDPSEDLTAIERIFAPPKPPPLTAFPELREQWKDTPAFLRDSKFNINARSYFRDAVNVPGSTNIEQAWASGGSVSAETGKLFDLVSLGAVLYTSFPVVAPPEYGNTLLLLPDQAGYAVFGQLYAQAHLFEDHKVTVGRYLYNTPFMGPHDNRMSPQTFSGYSVIGTFGGDDKDGPHFLYGVGYIDAIKPRDSFSFQSMASAAGVPTSNAGLGFAGGLLTWGGASIGAINYYAQDLLNIFYTEGKYGKDLGDGFSFMAAAQFVAQNSTGQALMNGGRPFATNQFGTKVEVGYDTGILTVGYSVVNPNLAIQIPWSASPFYTYALIQGFLRAGEQAVMIGLSQTLKPVGLPDIAVAAHFFNGWTSAAAAGAPLVESEWDFHIDWRPSHKPLQGLWFRTQYGRSTVWQGGTVANSEELRVVLNYDLKLY